jgi:membrane protease YdiL (CAAX protease family)
VFRVGDGKVQAFVRRHPLAVYFPLAAAVTWLLWLPLVASEYGWVRRVVPEWWHYAGALGPVPAAVIVAAAIGGLRELVGQYSPARVTVRWLLFAVLSPPALFGIGVLAGRVMDGTWPSYAGIAKAGNLPAIGLPLTWLVQTLTFGIGEETGWRGFALPRLQKTHSAIVATLLLVVPWLLWHWPSFLHNEGYRTLGVGGTFGWAIGLLAGAVFLTWLYNSSGRSLLVVVLWHGLFNTVVASEAAEGAIAAVATTIVMVGAVVVLVLGTPARLSGLRWPRRERAA